MKPIFTALILCLAIAGCFAAPNEFRAIWIQSTLPTAEVPAPEGFLITPAQAVDIARESGALSIKHIWYIYADARYYYVHDTFLNDSAGHAYKVGLRIDGVTGGIVPR